MQHRSFALTIVLLVLAFTPAIPADASETVWSGLVMANNVPEPTPIPAELNRFEGTLKAIFGYNQFQVIGESRKTLNTGEEDWLATSKYFSLHVDSKAAKRSSYVLNLQLFQEQKLLLETEAKLTKASPLVIKGPQVGDGQLVLLLVIE
jgi:opacity protein-like surface antigen